MVGLVRSPAFSHGAVIPPGATTIYIGGQNGVDDTGQVVASHDAAAQAVRAVDNVETVLRAAGATLADVVAWTVLIAADADVALLQKVPSCNAVQMFVVRCHHCG